MASSEFELRPATSASHLLASPRTNEYPVLIHSPNRRKCRDVIWIVPFAAMLSFVLYFGLRGAKLVTSPRNYCNLVPSNALDGGLPSAPGSSGKDIYSNCIHFVVAGKLSDARSQCLLFAINTIASPTNPSKRSILSLSDNATQPSEHRISERGLPGITLPPQLQSAFTLCTLYMSMKLPNAPYQCVQYGLLNALDVAGAGNTTSFQAIMTACVEPIATGSSIKVNSCLDGVARVLPGSTAAAIESGKVVSACVDGGISKVEQCVQDALLKANVTLPVAQSFVDKCVQPVIVNGGGLKAMDACVLFGVQTVFPAVPDVTGGYDTCVRPFVNGTVSVTDKDGAVAVAVRCLEAGVTRVLGGAAPVFQLIERAIAGVLGGGDLGAAFSSSCLAKTVGDLSAGSGFDIVKGCLFQGLATQFCADVERAVEGSIALGLNAYFTSFKDRVAQSAVRLALTLTGIIAAGVGMACVWMSVLILFGEGLIRFSIVGTILNLLILTIINFAILNIPVAVFLLVYLVIKIAWYIYIYKRIAFAAALLKVTVAHLRRRPGAFFLATFLFLWNAGWCFLFGCAYLEIYSPNVIPDPNLMTTCLVILVLGFFWSFEVWKGLLGVSVAGSLGTWYYFGHDDDDAKRGKSRDPSQRQQDLPFQLRQPILASFFQAISYSFGSICLSSLILAALKTGHYFYKRGKNTSSVWLKALIEFFFGWMEFILKVYNLYSLVRVGVEYEPYCEAASKTWGLIQDQGIDALVNDDSIENVTSSTSTLGSITLGTIAFILAKIMYRLDWDITLLCVIVSLLFGYAMLSIMGVTVEMGTVALFVVMAEDPEVLMVRHRRECGVLVEALIERCRDRGWAVPKEFLMLKEKMDVGSGEKVSDPQAIEEKAAAVAEHSEEDYLDDSMCEEPKTPLSILVVCY
ncbi:putative choline transporter, neither null mutation nor overexpression affects choline transport [Chytriomyces hyalinus]|nr:putative choline transporter, neither null mutation nor overexpression affects choline transport [Chytriomyces hyalinus]